MSIWNTIKDTALGFVQESEGAALYKDYADKVDAFKRARNKFSEYEQKGDTANADKVLADLKTMQDHLGSVEKQLATAEYDSSDKVNAFISAVSGGFTGALDDYVTEGDIRDDQSARILGKNVDAAASIAGGAAGPIGAGIRGVIGGTARGVGSAAGGTANTIAPQLSGRIAESVGKVTGASRPYQGFAKETGKGLYKWGEGRAKQAIGRPAGAFQAVEGRREVLQAVPRGLYHGILKKTPTVQALKAAKDKILSEAKKQGVKVTDEVAESLAQQGGSASKAVKEFAEQQAKRQGPFDSRNPFGYQRGTPGILTSDEDRKRRHNIMAMSTLPSAANKAYNAYKKIPPEAKGIIGGLGALELERQYNETRDTIDEYIDGLPADSSSPNTEPNKSLLQRGQGSDRPNPGLLGGVRMPGAEERKRRATQGGMQDSSADYRQAHEISGFEKRMTAGPVSGAFSDAAQDFLGFGEFDTPAAVLGMAVGPGRIGKGARAGKEVAEGLVKRGPKSKQRTVLFNGEEFTGTVAEIAEKTGKKPGTIRQQLKRDSDAGKNITDLSADGRTTRSDHNLVRQQKHDYVVQRNEKSIKDVEDGIKRLEGYIANNNAGYRGSAKHKRNPGKYNKFLEKRIAIKKNRIERMKQQSKESTPDTYKGVKQHKLGPDGKVIGEVEPKQFHKPTPEESRGIMQRAEAKRGEVADHMADKVGEFEDFIDGVDPNAEASIDELLEMFESVVETHLDKGEVIRNLRKFYNQPSL